MVDTDDIINQALKEDQARKEAKRKAKEGVPERDKGKTLEEIEHEEGGPVKESMAGMAHVKRAKKRKDRDAEDDVELPTRIEAVEEEQQVQEEDGMMFTAFNLVEEREHGFFDEEGNYVERKDEDEDAKDAWLAADGGAVVSAQVLQKIEARERLQAQEDEARPLSGRELAELKSKIVALMQAGESIPQTLKRLGGSKNRQGQVRGGRNSKTPKQEMTAEQRKATEDINMITAAASTLMLQGEIDIYDMSKEELMRGVALYAPAPAVLAGDDDGDDMFASDDEGQQHPAPSAAATGQNGAHQAQTEAAGGEVIALQPGDQQLLPASAATTAAAVEDEVDYSSWPVKELRRFLQERGHDASGLVEKAELVAKVQEVAAVGPEGDIPAGFVYDPSSGYYYSPEQQLFYDAASTMYYSGKDGQWYSWDAATNEYKLVQG